MGGQLSVTAGSWQPVSREEHTRPPHVRSTAGGEDWEMPGLAEAAFSGSSFENKLQDSGEEPSLHTGSLARFRK